MVEVRRDSVVGLEAKLVFEFSVAEWFTDEYSKIPPHMQEAIQRYVIDRLAPGDFLRAVVENNLRRAVHSADEVNLSLLPLYVKFFYNRAPAGCHGSPQAVAAWLSSK
jgi:hypothetical protein